MITKQRLCRASLLAIIAAMVLMPGNSFARPLATASSYGGTYDSWPTDLQWKPIAALNDLDDGAKDGLDLVGDNINPGVYWFSRSDYLFFRIRVDDGAATEFSDTHMLIIDGNNNGILDAAANPRTNSTDFAFGWDTQSTDQDKHGLELEVAGSIGSTWGTTKMDDVDGKNADKDAPPDFGLANGDGYVRILNGQTTTNFDTTTFIDFAIKWSFLETNTTLRKNQTWGLQVGTLANSNDHNFVDTDVAGGKAPTDPMTFPATIGTNSNAVRLSALAASQLPSSLLTGSTLLIASAAVVKGGLLLRRRRGLAVR